MNDGGDSEPGRTEGEELERAVPRAVVGLAAASILYGLGDLLRPGQTSGEIAYYAAAVTLPLLGLAAGRRAGLPTLPVMVAIDLVWTTIVGLGLAVAPNATVSGSAYILSLKWLGSALVIPWPIRVQMFSAAAGLAVYYAAVLSLDRSGPLFVHQWLLPPIAAALSVLGARALHDAREQTRRQAALVESSERQLRALLDNSPDGMFVCRAGTLVFTNRRLLRLLGRDAADDLRGVAAASLAIGADREAFSRFLVTAEQHSDPGAPESLHFERGAQPLPVTVSAVPLLYRGEPCVQVTVRETTSEQRHLILLEGERSVLGQIASGTPLARQLETICRLIERLGPHLRTSILLAAEGGMRLAHGAGPSLAAAYLEAVDGLEIRDGNGTCGTAAARREPVFTADVQTDPAWAAYRDLARANDIGACWSMPVLSSDGELLGTFASYARTPGMPSEEWLESVRHAAHLVRIAVQRRRMEVERDEQIFLSRTLAELGRTLISSIEEPVLLQQLCRKTREALGADVSHVYLVDPEDGAFVPTAGDGDTPEQWEQLRVVRIARELLGPVLAVVETTDSVEISAERNSHLLPAGFQAAFGIHAGLFVALRRGNTLIGTITAGHRQPAPPFSEHQHRLARGIAQLATLALSNSRLMRQLDEANRVKSNFVATMSHELRTPLNVLIGYQDLLRDGEMGPLNDAQREVVDRLSHYARQLLALINDTLDLSRLEAGRVDVHPEDVDVGALLARLRSETRDAWGDRGLALDFAWDEGLHLRTDPGKLHVILRCLVSNAIKFTDAGAVTVRARRNGDAIEVSVADTGIGIAPEDQASIFEPFTQAEPAISARFGGAGLGLHIVRRFLDMLGGTIALESTPGVGSTFRVRLPATTGDGD